MKRILTRSMGLGAAVAWASLGLCADPAEPLFRDASPAVVVESTVRLSPAQTVAISQKLGGKIQQLTNSKVRVHGRSIQVNAITAEDDANAEAILAQVATLKPHPFCLRKGRVVVEYVGKDIDPAIAIKTTYELGLQPRPERVRYRVIAEIAAIEKAEYMACNPLFNHFLATASRSDPGSLEKIKELTPRFQFGRTVVLRHPSQGGSATHAFQPEPSGSPDSLGATHAYVFDRLPERHGVPYVDVVIETTATDTGFYPSPEPPSPALTASTPFWPVEDPDVVALARRITAGRTDNDAKAAAILEWLSPGRNLKYSGQTGSRWGTSKVLAQKFGHCWDFSDCFVTLGRAAGVPCRQVAGWLFGSSGHVWAEFHREDQGWQQVDPTGGNRLACGIYHLAYFTTEDGEMPILYLSMPKVEALPKG